MNLRTCTSCHQLFAHTEKSCPHCLTQPSSLSKASITLLLGLGLSACDTIKPEPDTTPLYGAEEIPDLDEDGFYYGNDCDDEDAFTYPGAAPQDSEEDCMTDADQDGYGDANPTNPDVTPGTDCDDSDPDVNPGANNCP